MSTVTTTYNFWTTEEETRLLQMLEQGIIEYAIGRELQRPYVAVRKKLVRMRAQYNVPNTTALIAKCIREGRI